MAKPKSTLTRRLTSALLRPRRIGVIFALLVAAWLTSGFAQKAYTTYQLNLEAQTIARQNEALREANKGYQQQLDAMSQQDGMEEEARQHNYIRPDEKAYIVALPSPSPTAQPPSTTAAAHSGGVWDAIWGFLTSPFRH